MPVGVSRRSFGRTLAAGAASFAVLRHARGDEPIRLRCSLDTAMSHVRNVSLVDYLTKLESKTGGKIVGEVFHAGQLYADLNVSKALLQGQVDMAVPGAWTQTGLVSDCDFPQLPVFYGRDVDVTHRASDGKPGALCVSQLEAKLHVKVLGPWIDIGFQNWYTTKRAIDTPDDLRGLKIRSPGGAGLAWRINLFGAIPNTTAWPNVPLALSQGTFDGFVSTDESCASSKLWEAGVRHCYADHQYVGQYIPMMSGTFWGKLTPDLRATMVSLWAENFGHYRANAFAAQANARKLMVENGVTYVDPTEAAASANRDRLEADVATLIQNAKLSPEIVKASRDSVAGQA